MRKCAVLFCAFVVATVGAAVVFSPLCGVAGDVRVYENNAPIARVDGVCYLPDACVRTDFDGDETAMYSALAALGAEIVKRAETDDAVIVYAFCPRVCAASEALADGGEFNVMAACRAGKIAIGAPVLEGWY